MTQSDSHHPGSDGECRAVTGRARLREEEAIEVTVRESRLVSKQRELREPGCGRFQRPGGAVTRARAAECETPGTCPDPGEMKIRAGHG